MSNLAQRAQNLIDNILRTSPRKYVDESCFLIADLLEENDTLRERVRELEAVNKDNHDRAEAIILAREKQILRMHDEFNDLRAKLSRYEQGLGITVDVCQGQHGDSFIFLPDQFAGQRVTVIVLGESRRYTLTPKERDNKAINTSVSDTGTTMLPLVGCVDSQMIST